MSKKTDQDLRDLVKGNIGTVSRPNHKAELFVDLSHFFSAYNHDITMLHELKKGFNLVFGKIDGAFLWNDILEAATRDITPEELQLIEQSPANACMKNAFIEIVKNACDEKILSQLNNKLHPDQCARIKLEIDLSVQDKISMTVTDNGQGFSQAFLDKVSTRELREQYIMKTGSDKERHPLLFGGRGQGLRDFIANVEHGAIQGALLDFPPHLKRKYEQDDITKLDSSITFGNKKDGTGVSITITMPAKPIQLIVQTFQEENDDVILALPLKRLARQKNRSHNTNEMNENHTNMKENFAALRGQSPQSVAMDIDLLQHK